MSAKPYVYNPNPAPLPLWKYVFAGGVAGIVEILSMYPLDVVKTRLQLQQTGKSITGITYNGVMDCFGKIIKQERIGTLYRGILAPIFAEAPKRAVKFSTNEYYKKLFTRFGMPHNETKMFSAGLFAGITEALVNCPFEVVKVRMQAKGSKYTSTPNAVYRLLTEEGIESLYKGIVAQTLRNSVWDSVYFALIFTLKIRVLPEPKSKSQELGRNFIAGVLASMVATTCATPLDCVKSRMQSAIAGEESRWKSVFGTMQIIYNEEGGLPACFKGLAPRLLRLAPGGGIMLVAFDFISGWLGPTNK